MGHLFRFLGTRQAGGSIWQVEGDEYHHAAKVLRLQVGAEAEILDGQGLRAKGRVVEMASGRMLVEATEETMEPVPAGKLAVAVGALQSGILDDLIPMLVELGLDELHVFGQPGVAASRLADRVGDRWQRLVVSAMKQCGRARRPVLAVHRDLAGVVAHFSSWSTRLFGEDSSTCRVRERWRPGDTVVAIGGERGLDQGEQSLLAQAGWQGVAFGPHVLRARTAVVVGAALIADCRETGLSSSMMVK